MKMPSFETEHFFARYEFNTPYQLCNSDCDSISIAELLSLAGGSLEQFGRQRLVYTPSQGSSDLRQSIASIHQRVNPEDVIMLGTPVEGIYLAARALLDPGDEVIVLNPAYDALIKMFEHVAGESNVREWAFRPGATSWELDLEDLRALLTPRTKLLVVNFPHNPTGYLPTAQFQQELAGLAAEHDAWLFCDEMYFGLVQPGTPQIPSMADLGENTVVLSGLSKTYGLPGLRCGWLIVPDPVLRENIMNWKFYTSICPPVATEYLAMAALRARESLCDRNIARIGENLDRADAFFSRWPGLFSWRRPRAGSTALIGYDVPSVADLAEKLAREEGILIQSAVMLGGDDQHMRMGFGRDGFAEALARFENWLERGSAPG